MTLIRTCRDCNIHIANHRSLKADPTLKAAGVRENAGRCLCRACYCRRTKNGTLIDVERLSYTRDQVLDEWETLRDEGVQVTEAAKRLGMTTEALIKALYRARQLGDPRARFDWTGAWRARKPKTVVDSRFHADPVSSSADKMGKQNGPGWCANTSYSGASPLPNARKELP